MGLFSSKNTTSSTGTFDRTSTSSLPDWATGPIQGSLARTYQLGTTTDPMSLVAGPSDLEKQGYRIASTLTPQPWNQDNAVGWTNDVALAGAPRVQAASLLDGLQNYFNPYDQQVIQASAADFDANAAQTRAQQTLADAGARSFGGYDSGAILGKSLTEGELARARGSLLSGLRQTGFNTATGLSNEDAARRQQADALNAQMAQQQNQQKLAAANQVQSLVNGYDANARSNIATMGDVGGLFRGIQQAQQTAPLDLQSWLNSQVSGLPLGLFGTTNETGTSSETGATKNAPSGMSKAGQVASTAAAVLGLFSDVRLKTDIEPAGTDAQGRAWYDYRYLWDPEGTIRRGVMAQEILHTDPEAVSVHPSGYLMVDYAKLEG